MAVKEQKRKYTQQEYLELERKTEYKSEFYQGEIFAMSGASREHNVISVNLIAFLVQNLKGKNCRPYGSDLRIHIPINSLYTYPDISVVCGKEEFLDGEMDTLLNPVFICEVLSKSTSDYDTGGKFTLYRSIPTLKEYWALSSYEYRLEKFVKQSTGEWLLSETVNATDTMTLESLQLSVPLNEIYEGVKF